MRFLFFVTIFLSIDLPLFSQPSTNKWSLNKCIRYALENNISIKRGDIQASLEQLRLKQLKLSYYPSVNLTSSLGNQFGKSIDPLTYSFTTNQLLTQRYDLSGYINLYNFGSTRNAVRSQKNTTRSKLLIADKVRSDIILNVIAYYFQILCAGDEININQIQLEQSQKQCETTKAHVKTGTLPELNLLQSEAQLSSDSINVLNSRAIYANNILAIKSLLGVNDESEFNLEIPLESDIKRKVMQTAESIYQLALQNQPEQQSYNLRIKATELNIKVLKVSMLPTFSINYDVNSVFSSYIKSKPFNKWWNNYNSQLNRNFNQQVFLKMNIPIFNNGRPRFNYQQTKLNLRDLEYEQMQANAKLRQDIFSAFSDASIALSKLSIAENMVNKLQEAYDVTYSGYKAGGIRLLDLITSQNQLFKAKLQLLNTRYDYAFKVKLLDFFKDPRVILD